MTMQYQNYVLAISKAEMQNASKYFFLWNELSNECSYSNRKTTGGALTCITFHSEIERENNYILCDLVSPKEIYV